jgi:MATE family multidrug resistance protein
MRQLFREGWPVAVAYCGEGGSYAFAGLMLGWFGAAALAANQVVGSIAEVLYMLPLGMAAAVGIRVGQAIGAEETHRLRAIGVSAIGLVIAWMVVVTIVLVTFRRDIADALSDDPEVIALAVSMFLTIAFMQFADGVQSASLGALRGMIDNRVPTLISLVAYWGFALPIGYVFGFTLGFGPVGVWVGYGLGILAAAIALVWRFWAKTATP